MHVLIVSVRSVSTNQSRAAHTLRLDVIHVPANHWTKPASKHAAPTTAPTSRLSADHVSRSFHAAHPAPSTATNEPMNAAKYAPTPTTKGPANDEPERKQPPNELQPHRPGLQHLRPRLDSTHEREPMSDIGNWTSPTARKQHRCETCGRSIEAGEKYRRYDGIYDGRACTWKNCDHCSALMSVFDLYDIYDEGIGSDEVSEWEPETVAGLRAKVHWRKQWERPNGLLYPVPQRVEPTP